MEFAGGCVSLPEVNSCQEDSDRLALGTGGNSIGAICLGQSWQQHGAARINGRASKATYTMGITGACKRCSAMCSRERALALVVKVAVAQGAAEPK
jgi:hypothetical protein